MKKYCILLIALFAACASYAQIEGDLSVTRKRLCRRGDALFMELEIRVKGDAVTRSQSWTIIPELSTPDRRSMKLFPHVVVNGKYQQHMMERRARLTGAHWAEREPYAVVVSDGRTDRTIRYEMTVPYEEWMASATLVLRQIQTSPGERRRVFTVDVNGAVDTETGEK